MRLHLIHHHRHINWDDPLTFLWVAGAALVAVTVVVYSAMAAL